MKSAQTPPTASGHPSSYILELDLPEAGARLSTSPRFQCFLTQSYSNANPPSHSPLLRSPSSPLYGVKSFLNLTPDSLITQSLNLRNSFPFPEMQSPSYPATSPYVGDTQMTIENLDPDCTIIHLGSKPIVLNPTRPLGFQRNAPPALHLEASTHRPRATQYSSEDLLVDTADVIDIPSLPVSSSPTAVDSYRLSSCSSHCSTPILCSAMELRRRRILKLQRTFGEIVPLELVTFAAPPHVPTLAVGSLHHAWRHGPGSHLEVDESQLPGGSKRVCSLDLGGLVEVGSEGGSGKGSQKESIFRETHSGCDQQAQTDGLHGAVANKRSEKSKSSFVLIVNEYEEDTHSPADEDEDDHDHDHRPLSSPSLYSCASTATSQSTLATSPCSPVYPSFASSASWPSPSAHLRSRSDDTDPTDDDDDEEAGRHRHPLCPSDLDTLSGHMPSPVQYWPRTPFAHTFSQVEAVQQGATPRSALGLSSADLLCVPTEASTGVGAGASTQRSERRHGWSGEWNQPHIRDVIQKLRDI